MPGRPPSSPALRRAVTLALLAGLAGCQDRFGPPTCSEATEKEQIVSGMRAFYLWRTQLPATVDTSLPPADMLDALTAPLRAQGLDRHFTYLTTKAQSTTFFQQGQNLGFGFGLDTRGSQLFVAQTFPGSSVEVAGLHRGDQLRAIATSEAGLTDAASQVPAILAADLATPGALSHALGSDTSLAGPPSRRWFVVQKAGAVSPAPAFSMDRALYSLDPVPGVTAGGVPALITFDQAGHKVGYLQLRTFVATADALLDKAFAAFKAAGVTDLIVDLRYNGGGLLNTAVTLGDLLGGDRLATDLMFEVRYASGPSTLIDFAPGTSSLAPGKVAFIVRGGSASASELVVNALQPYLDATGAAPRLAIVGDHTYGKPVGQTSYENLDCDWLLYLVAFQLFNSAGQGSYFTGLPDQHFTGDRCAAADDLSHDMGDAAEASTGAALAWITGGACPGAQIPLTDSGPAIGRQALAETRAVASNATVAQRHVPGLH